MGALAQLGLPQVPVSDIPLSLFSGTDSELSPSDCPEGVSPDNQDVAYVPGSVATRPCLHTVLNRGVGPVGIVYQKTYLQPNGDPLTLFLDGAGNLWSEDVLNSPGVYTQLFRTAPGSYCQSVTAFGREYLAFTDLLHGLDIPRQFDGTFLDRVTQDGPGAAPTVVDGAAGDSSVGQYQCVQMFLTRQGYLTTPSPPCIFTSAGSKQFNVSNLAIGPSNVLARVLAFTPANGANFFTILANISLPNPSGGSSQTVVKALVIPDNTSTTATVDFSDNALMAADAIDIPGNDLFDQVVLGPIAGFFTYASRLFAWGEPNKINNFLNMGFEGGYLSGAMNTPLGWTVDTAGGTLVSGVADFGLAWQIIGDGSGNAKGRITQTAYRDGFGDPILSPSTQYTFRCWAETNILSSDGNIICDFYSPTSGVLATAKIPISSVTLAGGFLSAQFNAQTPVTIPSDTVLRVYEIGLDNQIALTLDENEIVFTQSPFRENLARGSYVNSPESFAQTTCDIGSASDPSPIRSMTMLRNEILLKSYSGLHTFQDNNIGEPSTWNVNEVTRAVGCIAARGSDKGQFGSGDAAENWDVTLGYDGLYLYSGGELWKVSQEYQTFFNTINRKFQHIAWVKNDNTNRRVLIGLPTGSSSTINQIFVMDYRELSTAVQIATSPPVHISFTGKMIASDLTRKWTRWNIPAQCCELIRRPNNVDQMQVGLAGFGNLYWFDPAKLTDDDLGAFVPYYVTYFFINHEMEMALQVGSHRKLYKKLCAFISGVGLVTWTPLGNSLVNPFPALSTRQLAADNSQGTAVSEDLEWTLHHRAQRMAFKLTIQPITDKLSPVYTNATDVQFNLQKLIVTISKDPIATHRSMAV